jgi:hypothetical protein
MRRRVEQRKDRPQHRNEDHADRMPHHEPHNAAMHVLKPVLHGADLFALH